MAGGWGTPSWMGGAPVEGEVYVWGTTRETARALLDAAAAAGVDPHEVRTSHGGFIVPQAVYDQYQTDQAVADGTDF